LLGAPCSFKWLNFWRNSN